MDKKTKQILDMYEQEILKAPCIKSYELTDKTINMEFFDNHECNKCQSQFCFPDCDWNDKDLELHLNNDCEGMYV